MKSVTRRALLVSLIFHLFFLTTTFYFVVRNQPIGSEKIGLAGELISVENTSRPRTLLKKVSPRFLASERDFTNLHVSTSESPPSLASAITVNTETPRPASGRSLQDEVKAENPSTSLDLSIKNWNEVSTATRTLQNIKKNLSKTEAASPAGDTTFGTKRSGPPRIQRAPEISTLKIVEEEEGLSPALLTEISEKRKALPHVPFSTLMKTLAQEIAETSDGAPIDVVFVIDASGSMRDNIKSVVEHLSEMVNVYKASKINYALGVTEFWANQNRNRIRVVQLTKSFINYKRTLQAIEVHQDENALDAIVQTVKELRFRPTSKRHFILVTDEPLSSREGLEVSDTIAYCREFGIYVNVLGLPLNEHQRLAFETGGKWHLIPEEPRPQIVQSPRTPANPRNKVLSLRHAQWNDITKIRDNLIQYSVDTPVDIILFVDSSESMEGKLPHFLKQLDLLVRDFDNALIDYQMGVVRFRSRASVNIVNVFNPPQTIAQIRKIVELPCKENEMLLDAVAESLRRIKFRPKAQPYFILVTDEPAEGAYSAPAIIQMLQQRDILVSVVGTYDDFQQKVANKTGGVWVPIPDGHTTNNSYW